MAPHTFLSVSTLLLFLFQLLLLLPPATCQTQIGFFSGQLNGDYISNTVSISGNMIVAGSYENQPVQVYTCTESACSQFDAIQPVSGSQRFSFNVAIDGTLVAAHDYETGEVHVFSCASSPCVSYLSGAITTQVNNDYGLSFSQNLLVVGNANVSGYMVLDCSTSSCSPVSGSPLVIAGMTPMGVVSISNGLVAAAFNDGILSYVYFFTCSAAAGCVQLNGNVSTQNILPSLSVSESVVAIGLHGLGTVEQGGVIMASCDLVAGSCSKSVPLFSSSEAVAGDEFGWAVGLSGSSLVVGAWATNSRGGVAYTYACNATYCEQVGTSFTYTGDQAQNNFGGVIGIAGSLVVIEAEAYPSNLGKGAVCMFRLSKLASLLY